MYVILIPSYEPDARLVALVRALRATEPERVVVVVDDGSGERYRAVFAEAALAGAVLLAHRANRGKGAALRTGLRFIREAYPGADVVTADGDGQHTPLDIERVGLRTGDHPHDLVLGVRSFVGAVPLRSRLGNAATRALFRVVSGQDVADTQTGLRGIPAPILDWMLTVPGDRFDYEFRVLLGARAAGVALAQEPIATVYADGNASSHFRPVLDSLRIYAPLLRFGASALAAFAVDTAALLLLNALTGWLLFSVIGARVLSAAMNFTVNRSMVFRRGRDVPVRTAAVRYISLAAVLLAANFGLLTAFTDAGVPLLAAKALTDAGLFVVSFGVQRAVVFAPDSGMNRGDARLHMYSASFRR
jgi:glycosyltransferase involved in cell wall biosynthesis